MTPRTIRALCLLWLSSPAFADPLVTGDVSFDEQSGYYTYTYTINAADLPTPDLVQFGIVADYSGTPVWPRPPTYASNTDWVLEVSYGGWYREDIDVNGTFYKWRGLTPQAAPQLVFWFSTLEAPDTSGRNNYYIWTPSTMGPENLPLDFGRVVGPNMRYVAPPPIPEPASAVLMALGLGVVARTARGRRGRADRAVAGSLPIESALVPRCILTCRPN